jgi:hypothetical protein
LPLESHMGRFQKQVPGGQKGLQTATSN